VLASKTFLSPQTNQFIDYPMRRQSLKSKNRDNIPIPLCKVGYTLYEDVALILQK